MKDNNVSGYEHTFSQLNAYNNQLNPDHPAYQANLDNRTNQLNPKHKEFKGKK